MVDGVSLLKAILLADPAVAAIVGARVSAWPANQTVQLPCVLLTQVSCTRIPTMAGSPTFDRARVQVDCLARSHQERAQLSSAVRDALSDYSGAGIQRILFEGASERTDDRAGNYGMMMEFVVFTTS